MAERMVESPVEFRPERITVMGKVFDPARPEAYLRSFAIRRT